MSKLKRKQYCWKIDEHAKGYSCVFLYVRQNEKLTHDEEVRLDLDNPNAAISFHKLLIAAGYKYKQIEIVTTPEWAAVQ